MAPSFIRFGNFQIFSARQDLKTLRELTDYTIRYFFPEVEGGSKEGYLKFFETIVDRTLELIIQWQRVGFVHGVMNTDNMSILGLTIDYGPYGWLEGFEPGWTPNTTDRQNKRYRFGNQGKVAYWNLYQLANALYPLIEEVEPLEELLKKYADNYNVAYTQMMRSKLGLQSSEDMDPRLIDQLEGALQLVETDMTIFFRELTGWDVDSKLEDDKALTSEVLHAWKKWLKEYNNRLLQEAAIPQERKSLMNQVNPKYVLRNYMVQLAIDQAEAGNYNLISELHELLKHPYKEQPQSEKWYAKRPEWARHKVGCSMLSCSS
ncbi:UNVERIFIED_CONTAM: hypothetical protein GTU68_039340 [Idotea baltica]|nr:hypothetical protein [Idotea baltica]